MFKNSIKKQNKEQEMRNDVKRGEERILKFKIIKQCLQFNGVLNFTSDM